MQLKCSRHELNFDKTLVMGVVNVTPDSFFGGSRVYSFASAIRQAEIMLESGADIIDVGGESTRPGGQDRLNEQEEIDRVTKIIEYISGTLGAVVSSDTSSPKVMEAVVQAGASIINDVRALQRPGALEMAASLEVPIILMHSLVDQPAQGFVPHYDDVVTEVSDYLADRIRICEKAGITRDRIIIDPGFGGGMFGKTTQHDLTMIQQFKAFHAFGLPVLAGVSRKSFIGNTLDKPVEERLSGSLAAAALLTYAGTHIIRVHDVAETVDVVKLIEAVKAV
ncbi:MAG: dihydropteroate synthase [Endozoicomonadaceae bacterium]|nr:dihydropteroate synthase [Endozoicomonadaceae bacterium]